jgi:hypothetical protein
MARYTKGGYHRTAPIQKPLPSAGPDRPACSVCLGTGVMKDPDDSTRIVRCPCGAWVHHHSVVKRLRKQDELDSRLAAVKKGQW